MSTWKNVIGTLPSCLKQGFQSHFAKFCLNLSNWTLLAFLSKCKLFFDFFWLFLCKIYILDCNKGAWSRKTKKNWIWAVPGLSGQKSNFRPNGSRDGIFFSIFWPKGSLNKICSSAKKVSVKKKHFRPFYGRLAVWANSASTCFDHQNLMFRKWK